MIGILTRWVTALSVLLSCTACSDSTNSPSDQIIDGPFSVTTQWQELNLKKPLKSAPYIQHIQLLSCDQSLKLIATQPRHENYFLLLLVFMN